MVATNNTANLNSILKCPNCGRENTIIEDPLSGELVCRACGYVIEDHITDLRPPPMGFGKGDQRDRSSTKMISPSLPHQGIGGTVIGTTIKINKNSGIARLKIRSLINANEGIQYVDNVERRIKDLRDLLLSIKYRLNLPDSVIEEALTLYRQLSKRCGIKNYRTKDLALVLLYISCKRQKLGIQFRELKAALNADKSKRVSKLLTIARQCLINQSNGEPFIRSREELGRFLERVIGSLRLNEDIRYYVTKLSDSIVKEGEKLKLMNGRTAYSLIASAVYIAATLMGARRRQRDIADAAKVTDVTIRNRYKEVLSKMDIIIEV